MYRVQLVLGNEAILAYRYDKMLFGSRQFIDYIMGTVEITKTLVESQWNMIQDFIKAPIPCRSPGNPRGSY